MEFIPHPFLVPKFAPLLTCTLPRCIQGASLVPRRPVWALVFFKVRLLVFGLFSVWKSLAYLGAWC